MLRARIRERERERERVKDKKKLYYYLNENELKQILPASRTQKVKRVQLLKPVVIYQEEKYACVVMGMYLLKYHKYTVRSCIVQKTCCLLVGEYVMSIKDFVVFDPIVQDLINFHTEMVLFNCSVY